MSNVGRPRTGMPECPACGSTERDSNGQCACRNRAYRLRARTHRAGDGGCACGWTGKDHGRHVKAALKKAGLA